MLDLRFIRENLDAVRSNCAERHVDVDLDRLIALDHESRSLGSEQQDVRERRNRLASQMKGRKPDERERALGRELKTREAELDEALRKLRGDLSELHRRVPNTTHPASPPGADEEANEELRRVGEPPRFDFEPRDHVQLGGLHDLLDFEAGAKVAGQKFYYLKNELVLLEQALVRFALESLRGRGYTLFQTPDLARGEVAEGLGFNPRGDESQIYSVAGTDLVLVGTAEITLGGLHRDEILDADSLPRRYCGLSHCFRTEAGAAGRASKGLYRVHQFTKVEMFVVCGPRESAALHDELVEIEEDLFTRLEVPYRVVEVCRGDLGAPAHRKLDLEAWMPGRGDGGSWGEITSASNCTDYQARRLGVRYRDPESGHARFCHMLNGTALAVSRAIIAILENHQRADGSIAIPAALRPYAGFDSIG
ncbi:MAG: serine--tRNA ligase [Proteobacteria bacterium]|nr:serine--tRNA ligase [Pseudomonadota bacterium]